MKNVYILMIESGFVQRRVLDVACAVDVRAVLDEQIGDGNEALIARFVLSKQNNNDGVRVSAGRVMTEEKKRRTSGAQPAKSLAFTSVAGSCRSSSIASLSSFIKRYTKIQNVNRSNK